MDKELTHWLITRTAGSALLLSAVILATSTMTPNNSYYPLSIQKAGCAVRDAIKLSPCQPRP